MIDSLIPIAYTLALDAYSPHKAAPSLDAYLPHTAAPPLDAVRAAITPLSRWLHRVGDSLVYPRAKRPRIDVATALGQFAPQPRNKSVDDLTRPLGRLSLSHTTCPRPRPRPRKEGLSQCMGRLGVS
jgi:hypothetical protein